MKKFAIPLFLCFLLIPSFSAEASLYEEQLNKGIRNSESYSYLLIRQAKANRTEAKNLLKEALQYSPDLPAAYFELSKASFSFKPEDVFESVDYILQGIEAYQRNFWWSFMVTASLFASLILSFIFAILITVILRLLKDIPLFSHEIQEVKTKAMLLLALSFSVFGPLYMLGGILIITGLYMKKWDKAVVYLYFLFLLLSPVVFMPVSLILNAPASGELKAVIQVNEAKGNTYALSLLKDKNNPVELFSYALALKHEGRYSEAIDIYNKLIVRGPDPRIFNNLANCYVALNDMEKAKELYKKSIELKPSPAALYNISQAQRETLKFDKGEEYFIAAQKLDNNAVSRFREVFGRNPNRFVIDEGLPFSALWKYIKGRTTEISTLGFSTVSPPFMPVIAIFMAVLFYILDRQLKSRAHRCNRCGEILCSKCEKHVLWGQMCLNCYRSLVKLDELDAKERIPKILAVYNYKKRRRNIIKIISYILPGSGQIFAGNILFGLIFLWTFLFFLIVPIMNSVFVVGMSNFSHIWISLISLFLTALVYVLSNIITGRRLSKGWL
jgi:tetratricopeptide (TPR) repeat protein